MNLSTGGWASPLLRLVARLRSEGVNSTTPVTEINGGTISATNADIAIVAKGTGATLAQVPDGTTAGGNKRGQYATDLQKSRTAASYVASGLASTIGGGNSNTASAAWSTVAGGSTNSASGNFAAVAGGVGNSATGVASTVCGGNTHIASGDYSFVGGGQSNTAQTNTHATVCGGSTNTASGQWAVVGGGVSNTASGAGSVVVGGNTSTASGQYSFVGSGQVNSATGDNSVCVGGINNIANATRSAIVGGRQGTTRNISGYFVIPACDVPVANAVGVTQSVLLLLDRQTTDATPTVLTSNASAASTTNQVILPNNSAYAFKGTLIATVTGGGDTASWEFRGAIKRGATAANTSIVGTVIKDIIAYNPGAATWDVTFTADTTNGGLAVTVTGAAATTIRWVAKIETTEVTY